MTLIMVATSALTALLIFLSSHAPVWRVLCCSVPFRAVPCRAVPCRAVPCCAVLCVQLHQVKRMIGGIGNVLFSTCSQTLNV